MLKKLFRPKFFTIFFPAQIGRNKNEEIFDVELRPASGFRSGKFREGFSGQNWSGNWSTFLQSSATEDSGLKLEQAWAWVLSFDP